MAGNLNRDGADIAWFKYGDELAVKMIVTKQQALELIKDLQKEFAEELKADG